MPRKQISREHGTVRVTFELPAAVGGEVVHLVGDFTGWEGIPMKRHDDGWRATIDLAPGGTYEYRYLIDGERWENDWAADRYIRNAFGHENSVVDTPAVSEAAASDAEEAASVLKGTAKKAATKSGAAGRAGGAATKKTASRKTGGTTAARKTTTKKAAPKKLTTSRSTTKKATSKTSGPGATGATSRKRSADTSAPDTETDPSSGTDNATT